MDVSDYFPHTRGRWTWSQMRMGRYVRSVTDCILAENPEHFRRWTIKDPRYFSDHRALIAEITLTSVASHRHYLRRRRRFPVVLPRPLSKADQAFDDLHQFCRHSPAQALGDLLTVVVLYDVPMPDARYQVYPSRKWTGFLFSHCFLR